MLLLSPRVSDQRSHSDNLLEAPKLARQHPCIYKQQGHKDHPRRSYVWYLRIAHLTRSIILLEVGRREGEALAAVCNCDHSWHRGSDTAHSGAPVPETLRRARLLQWPSIPHHRTFAGKIARDTHSRQSMTMSQDACLALAIAMFCLLAQAFICFMLYFEELFFAVRYYCPNTSIRWSAVISYWMSL
jgi:hypothetical protein